ncbi:MAG: hypothetical protein H0U87_09525 [Acidobacteria bacterium]|jgi:hypothetical protein|nr:hypothetical protein [Acidobacteriota bacterium]
MKERISDEEFSRLESEARHDEVLSLLSKMERSTEADKQIESLLKEQVRLLETLAKKDFSVDTEGVASVMGDNLKQLKRALECRDPKRETFEVVRDKDGLIKQVIRIKND